MFSRIMKWLRGDSMKIDLPDYAAARHSAQSSQSVAEQMGVVPNKPHPMPEPVTIAVKEPNNLGDYAQLEGRAARKAQAPNPPPEAQPGDTVSVSSDLQMNKVAAELPATQLTDVQEKVDEKFEDKTAEAIAADNSKKLDRIATDTPLKPKPATKAKKQPGPTIDPKKMVPDEPTAVMAKSLKKAKAEPVSPGGKAKKR